MADLESLQQKAAELVLEDESWRDGIEDQIASPLLDWVLARMDAALAHAVEQDAVTEELPYRLAHQARAMLSSVGSAMQAFAEECRGG